MRGRQFAAYVGCLTVFVACVVVGYDALFPSPSAALHDSAVGLANAAAPLQPDPSKVPISSFSAAPSSEASKHDGGVSVLPNSAADQHPNRAEQRDTSKAPLFTIGKSEAGSNEPNIPRADDTTTSADRQRREENVGEGHRNRHQVRTIHRSDTYAHRDSIDGPKA